MFAIPDYLVVAVLREKLEFYSQHPEYLEFMLRDFETEPLCRIVPKGYVKQCIDFITENKVQVNTYYQIDMKRRPAVAVIASGREEMQFLGDYGASSESGVHQTLPPKIYEHFEVMSISGDTIEISLTKPEQANIWIRQKVKVGDFVARITGIRKSDTHEDRMILLLDQKVPDGTPLVDWISISDVRAKGLILNASTDSITVQMNLVTTGDPVIHTLLAMVLRNCLKSSRLRLDQFGFQVATFAYTPPMMSDPTELEMESTFTIEGKMTDLWIESVYDLPDSTGQIYVDLDISRK